MDEIYLDNAATTKIDSVVLKNMVKNAEIFGNASSSHSIGKLARKKITEARAEIAKFIGADAEEIVFTSGGSESNNLALKGLTFANKNKKHILISEIEHPCVMESARFLEELGWKVDKIKVDREGILDLNDLKNKIQKDTLVVSVMHVNNEIGTIQPVEEIGKICKKRGVYFHCDCVQSFCKLDIDVDKMNVDLISVSGHKVHAPKGIGFLYIRKGTKIQELIRGGGQEFGLRGGTENTLGILALSDSIKVKEDKSKIRKIRDEMLDELLRIKGARLNGSKEKRIYNNLNLSFYGIDGEALMLLLDKCEIEVSTGSACSSHKLKSSSVLKAMGVDELYINGSIRLTLGEINKKQAEFAVNKIKENVDKLQKISLFKIK